MEDQYYRKIRPDASVRKWLKKHVIRKKMLLILLISIPVFSFITFSNRGIVRRLELESEQRNIEEKIRESQEEQIRLQQQAKALENDARAIEKVAREKYGMIREGETVYKVRKVK